MDPVLFNNNYRYSFLAPFSHSINHFEEMSKKNQSLAAKVYHCVMGVLEAIPILNYLVSAVEYFACRRCFKQDLQYLKGKMTCESENGYGTLFIENFYSPKSGKAYTLDFAFDEDGFGYSCKEHSPVSKSRTRFFPDPWMIGFRDAYTFLELEENEIEKIFRDLNLEEEIELLKNDEQFSSFVARLKAKIVAAKEAHKKLQDEVNQNWETEQQRRSERGQWRRGHFAETSGGPRASSDWRHTQGGAYREADFTDFFSGNCGGNPFQSSASSSSSQALNLSHEELDALRLLEISHTNKPTEKEIHAAYRQLMRTAHPDKGGSNERAVTLGKAKECLLSMIKRF